MAKLRHIVSIIGEIDMVFKMLKALFNKAFLVSGVSFA